MLSPANTPSGYVQKKWVKKIGDIVEQAKKGEISLMVSDPTHTTHSNKKWQLKGKKNTVNV